MKEAQVYISEFFQLIHPVSNLSAMAVIPLVICCKNAFLLLVMLGQPMHNQHDRKRKLPTTKHRPAILPDYVIQSKPTTYLRSLKGPLVIMKFFKCLTKEVDI